MKITCKTKWSKTGFTLIEMLVVLGVISILTPAIYRLYIQGVRTSYDGFFKKATIARDAQLLVSYMRQDLRHAGQILDSFGDYKTGGDTLVFTSLSPASRHKISAYSGDLSSAVTNQKSNCVMVYTKTRDGQILRQTFYGQFEPKSTAGRISNNKAEIVFAAQDINGKDQIFKSDRQSKTVLMGYVANVLFSFNSKSIKTASLVVLMLEIRSEFKSVFPAGKLCSIFSIG